MTGGRVERDGGKEDEAVDSNTERRGQMQDRGEGVGEWVREERSCFGPPPPTHSPTLVPSLIQRAARHRFEKRKKKREKSHCLHLK